MYSLGTICQMLDQLDRRMSKLETKFEQITQPVSTKRYLDMKSEIETLQHQVYELKARIGEAEIYNYFEKKGETK